MAVSTNTMRKSRIVILSDYMQMCAVYEGERFPFLYLPSMHHS